MYEKEKEYKKSEETKKGSEDNHQQPNSGIGTSQSFKPGSPKSLYNQKVYQMLLKLFAQPDQHPEVIKVFGEEFVNFVLMC